MAKLFTAPLVGMQFKPPAKALVQVLPMATPLRLVAEIENEYDPDAIGVWLETANIPVGQRDTLQTMLGGFGMDWGDIEKQSAWHLGYVANSEKTGGKKATELGELVKWDTYRLEKSEARLGFSVEGKPIVMVEIKEEE